MENNLEIIGRALDFIEEHLWDETLDLDSVSKETGYSRYHLHRMFSAVVGFSIHHYIQRRRLTEAAQKLIFTGMPVLEIALCSGYETQRSFSRAFKAMFRCSPALFRKRRDFYPLQLKYDISNRNKLRGDKILDLKIISEDTIYLTGYDGSTKYGFQIIGKCWRRLHKNKARIENRTDEDFLFGINDYSLFEKHHDQPAFHYIAAARVNSPDHLPEGMTGFTLPPSRYIVFYFRGKNEDSLEPVVNYIYQEWFPNSSCVFNEKNLYDFAKYGESADENGESEIQFWVPVI